MSTVAEDLASVARSVIGIEAAVVTVRTAGLGGSAPTARPELRHAVGHRRSLTIAATTGVPPSGLRVMTVGTNLWAPRSSLLPSC